MLRYERGNQIPTLERKQWQQTSTLTVVSIVEGVVWRAYQNCCTYCPVATSWWFSITLRWKLNDDHLATLRTAKSNHGYLGHLQLMQLRDFVQHLTPCVSPTFSANRMHCCVVQLLEIPESTVYGKLSNLHHQTPRLTLRTPTGNNVAECCGIRETNGGKRDKRNHQSRMRPIEITNRMLHHKALSWCTT